MRVAIGSDHAGFELKETLKAFLAGKHEEVLDVGTHTREAVDYADYAAAVGAALREHRADRGIILCGSGVGASMAANRIPGIRAGLCHDTYSAHQGVEHDDMNVLVLGGRVVGSELAREAGGRLSERHVQRRAPASAPPRQGDRARKPGARAPGLRAVGLARLHPAQPDHQRRVAAADRGGRPPRGDLQPRHLREGDRRQLGLCRPPGGAWRRRDRRRDVVREAGDPGYPGRRRSAPRRVRRDEQARRLRQPGGVAPARLRHGGHARRSAAPVGRGGACEPDDQGTGHRRGHHGLPAADRGRHQRQRHAALRAGCLRARGGGVHRRARSAGRAGRRSGRGRQRGQLLRQPNRYGDRRPDRRPAAESRRCPRPGAAPVAAGQSGDRQRPARLPALSGAVRQPTLARPGRARRADAAAALGQHGNEKRQLSRRGLRRGVDRARHGQHDPAPDPHGVPGSRAPSREPHRGPRRRLRHDAYAGRNRHLAEGDDGRAADRRHSAVRRRVPQAAGGRRGAKSRDRSHAHPAALRPRAAAGVRDGCEGVARRLAGAREGEAALGARRDVVDRPR